MSNEILSILNAIDPMGCCVCEENDNLDEYAAEAAEIKRMLVKMIPTYVVVEMVLSKSFGFLPSEEVIHKIAESIDDLR